MNHVWSWDIYFNKMFSEHISNSRKLPTSDSPGFKDVFTLHQSHQLFSTKAHLNLQPTSRNSLWLGSWNKVFHFHWHFELGFICAFLYAVIKKNSILNWFSDLLFQHNIPICLGLISLSVDFYFLKVTSSHTSFSNHKQISPFSKPPPL